MGAIFCFETDAEMSLPCTPARALCATDPCAKPSAPHRCPGPRAGLSQLFPALSQCVSAALIASFVPFPSLGGDMFLFSISCSLSWDGGSSLQPSEVSLGFFILPPMPFSSPSQGQSTEGRRTPAACPACISRYMDNGDAVVPTTGAAPSPPGAPSCGPGMPFQGWVPPRGFAGLGVPLLPRGVQSSFAGTGGRCHEGRCHEGCSWL